MSEKDSVNSLVKKANSFIDSMDKDFDSFFKNIGVTRFASDVFTNPTLTNDPTIDETTKHCIINHPLDNFYNNFDTTWNKFKDKYPQSIDNFLSKNKNYTIEEKDDCLIYTFDMPGVLKEEIKAYINSGSPNILSVRAKNKTRDYSFDISITEDYMKDKLSSKFENGVLYVTIFKTKNKNKDTINIDIL
jgi:HSP20 family molecular chaperone IbpA